MIPQMRCCAELDCDVWFLVTSNVQKYCKACGYQRKLRSNRISHGVHSDDPIQVDEAEVERRYTEALAEIRRSGVHRVEAASWNYAGRYREP